MLAEPLIGPANEPCVRDLAAFTNTDVDVGVVVPMITGVRFDVEGR